MKIIKKNDLQVRCPDCETLIGYTGVDLRSTATGYSIECPICGKVIFFDKTPELEHLYMETHDHWACSYMDAAFKDDRP